MAKNQENIFEGIVTETLPNVNFKVKLDDGREVLARISGNMRRFRIRILVGDKVRVELSDYDETKGRVVYRFK